MRTLQFGGPPGARFGAIVLVAAKVACSRPPFVLAELPGPGDVEQQGSCIMMQHQIPGATLVSEEAKPGTQDQTLRRVPAPPSDRGTQASKRLRVDALPSHTAPQPEKSLQAQPDGSAATMPRGQSAQPAPWRGRPPSTGSKLPSESSAINETTVALGTTVSSLLMALKTAAADTQALRNMTMHLALVDELMALKESVLTKPYEAITWILPVVVLIFVLLVMRFYYVTFRVETTRQLPLGVGPAWPSSQRGSRPDTRAISPAVRSHSMAAPSKQGTSDPPRPDELAHSGAASSCLSSLPSRRSMGAEPVMHLCAELVVPEDTECNLVVPDLNLNAQGTTDRITIHDSSGLPVFHASYNLSSRHSNQSSRDTKRLILWSAIDGLIFAFCRDVEAAHGHASGLAIFHHYEVPFGVLRQNSLGDRSAYSVLMHTGREIFFYQTSEDVGFRAEDENGRLLAMVMGLAPRCVRIGPQVDAGLVTLAMLGIDLLELDARNQG